MILFPHYPRRLGPFTLATRISLAVLLAVVAWVWAPRTAAAADRVTLAGTWSASPLVERFNVGDWGEACGPRPSARDLPSGQVVIKEEGAELVFTGAGRTYRTGECWELLPGVSRASHAVSSRSWRNRCTSAPNDARQTTLNTTVTATDTTISLDETGEYQFRIEGQNCTASVRRSRNFNLIQRQGEAPFVPPTAAPLATTPTTASPTATAKEPPSPAAPTREAPPLLEAPPLPNARGVANKCDQPGEPARLEVRPTRKLMRPGERFSFRTVITDGNGCVLEARPSWTVGAGAGSINVANSGTVAVHDDAEDGTIDIAVSLGGKSVHVSVEIATPARYEALLSERSQSDAGDTDEAAVAVVTSGSLAANTAVAQDTARSRKTTFVIIIATLALGLAVLGILLLRRGSPPPSVREGTSSSRRSPPPIATVPAMPQGTLAVPGALVFPHLGQTLQCPSCRKEFPPGSTFCPHDGNALTPSLGAYPGPGASAGGAGGVCPTCGRGYNPGVKACPVHGDDLIPAAAYQATRQNAVIAVARGKICPSCGARYGGESTFCGKDGTALVLVN